MNELNTIVELNECIKFYEDDLDQLYKLEVNLLYNEDESAFDQLYNDYVRINNTLDCLYEKRNKLLNMLIGEEYDN